MENKVRHPQLVSLFKRIYPSTIGDVLHNQITARVVFCDVPFFIAPAFTCHCDKMERICDDCSAWARAGFPRDAITIWGDPHVNAFPETA